MSFFRCDRIIESLREIEAFLEEHEATHTTHISRKWRAALDASRELWGQAEFVADACTDGVQDHDLCDKDAL